MLRSKNGQMALQVDNLERNCADGCLEKTPDDFMLTLHYQSASVPPPYNYQYDIVIEQGGVGSISFRPGYPNSSAPQWTEPFIVTPEQCNDLLSSLIREGIFHRVWPELQGDLPCGGSIRWVDGIRSGAPFSIPAQLDGEDETATRPLFEAIELMVPAAVREGLEKRRLAWKKEYLTIEQKKCGFSFKAFLDNFF